MEAGDEGVSGRGVVWWQRGGGGDTNGQLVFG